ncbi:MAG: DUF4124 domain-containing protein [Gammaproteobacteria bacterium]
MLASAGICHAKKKLYRWVDEQGNVTFSDQIPPDQVQHKRDTLNEKAEVLQSLEKAETPEELAQQRRLELLRKEQEKIIAKQQAVDRVLLATYRSLDDMERALENKLALLDSKKRVIEGNRQRYEQQLFQQQQQAANMERNAQRVPEKLLTDIASTQKQIELSKQELSKHELESAGIEREFRLDMARFEMLTQDDQNKVISSHDSLTSADNEIGLFTCRDTQQCNEAWRIAGEYIYQNATTNRDVEGDRLIMTADPVKDDDLSLSASKLDDKGNQLIFFDIRCKASSIGRELCNSEKARAIRQGFSTYIQSRLTSQ